MTPACPRHIEVRPQESLRSHEDPPRREGGAERLPQAFQERSRSGRVHADDASRRRAARAAAFQASRLVGSELRVGTGYSMGRRSMRSRRDLLLATTLSGLAVVMMSGCTPPVGGLVSTSPSRPARSPDWHVGDCYAYTSAQARGFQNATHAVPCPQEHTGETVFVSPLVQTDRMEVERFWQTAVPGNGLLMFYPLLDDSPLADRCVDPALAYLGLDADQIPARFDVRYFVPSQAQWDQGDRTMRCDVVSQTLEVTDFGFEEQLRALPITVAGIADRAPPTEWVLCATFADQGNQRNLQQVGTCAFDGTHLCSHRPLRAEQAVHCRGSVPNGRRVIHRVGQPRHRDRRIRRGLLGFRWRTPRRLLLAHSRLERPDRVDPPHQVRDDQLVTIPQRLSMRPRSVATHAKSASTRPSPGQQSTRPPWCTSSTCGGPSASRTGRC